LSTRVLAESDSESVPTSTPTKQQPKKNIHVKTLEEIRLERVQAESAAFYAYSSPPVEPEPDRTTGSTAVASDWDGNGDSDLRAKIVSRKANRNSKANLGFRVMTLDEIRKSRQLEEGSYSAVDEKTSSAVNLSRDIHEKDASMNQFDVENNNATAEARFQIRQERFVSDYGSEEDRVICGGGDDDTVVPNRSLDSKGNGDTSETVSAGHIVIKTLAQIRAEKNSVVKDTSSSSIPKKRSHSPIVFDCLPQKHLCKNTETEEDGLKCAGDGKRKKPVIIRNHFLESGSGLDEKGSFQSRKKLCRLMRQTQHPQTNETKTDTEDVPRRQLHLRRNTNTSGTSSERSRVIRLTSHSFRGSEVAVEVPGNITDNVCSDALQTNGMLCLETGDAGCVRLGQPFTNISGDSLKSYSVSLMSSYVNSENSSPTFGTARSGLSQNSGISLQSTRSPPSSIVLRDHHLHSTPNESHGNRTAINKSLELQACERLESKLSLSTKNMDCILGADSEDCATKPLSAILTEQRNMDSYDSLLERINDNCVTLDAEEDILQDIDNLLSD